MSKDPTMLEQALKDAWLAGYDAAVARIEQDSGIHPDHDFERYMEQLIEKLENWRS